MSGHWDLLFGWNAVPLALVWDNEAAIGRRREGRVVLGHEFAALAGLLACKVILCRPRDPEAKGLLERANGYLETSFVPGRVFTSPAGFNTQLVAWLEVANRRVHRTLQARPAERWEAERAAMLALALTASSRWWQTPARTVQDHYIPLDHRSRDTSRGRDEIRRLKAATVGLLSFPHAVRTGITPQPDRSRELRNPGCKPPPERGGQGRTFSDHAGLAEFHETGPGGRREGQRSTVPVLRVPDHYLLWVIIGDFNTAIRLGVGTGAPVRHFSHDFPSPCDQNVQ